MPPVDASNDPLFYAALQRHERFKVTNARPHQQTNIRSSIAFQSSGSCLLDCCPAAIFRMFSIRHICFFAALWSAQASVPMTVNVEAYGEECFLLYAPEKPLQQIKGDYEMIDDGGETISSEPLLVYIMEGMDDKIVWRSQAGAKGGQFAVGLKPSLHYWLCIQNSSHAPDHAGDEPEHPDHRPRMIGFTYEITDLLKKPTPYVFTEQDIWMQNGVDIENDLQKLVHHHDYMRTREANHRGIVEATFTTVMGYSIAECVFVILVAVGQVLYFRRFLEKKQRYM